MNNKYINQAIVLGLDVPQSGTDREIMENLIYQIQQTSKLCGKSRMSCPQNRLPGVTGYDDTLNSYYVGFINDALRCARQNVQAYVFSLYHIYDICHYANNLKFEYLPESDSFKVTRNKKRKGGK